MFLPLFHTQNSRVSFLLFLVPVCPAFERLTHGFLIVLVGNPVGPTDGVRAVGELFEHPCRLIAWCATQIRSHFIEEIIQGKSVSLCKICFPIFRNIKSHMNIATSSCA